MRIGANITGTESASAKRTSKEMDRRFSETAYAEAMSRGNRAWTVSGSRLQELEGEETGEGGEPAEEAAAGRSEAEKIYQAAVAGKRNPIEDLREPSKVPYGYLAKDGIIEYNGVCFVCDEKTNSICLGDMTDEKNVLNIPLSGGGHLKVNRDSIGLLSKAIGMFSPEDVNRIMRAIAQDTKIQSVQKEIEDTEASVGNELSDRGDGENEDGSAEEDQP